MTKSCYKLRTKNFESWFHYIVSKLLVDSWINPVHRVVMEYLSAILSETFDLITRTFSSSSTFRMSLTDKTRPWLMLEMCSNPLHKSSSIHPYNFLLRKRKQGIILLAYDWLHNITFYHLISFQPLFQVLLQSNAGKSFCNYSCLSDKLWHTSRFNI